MDAEPPQTCRRADLAISLVSFPTRAVGARSAQVVSAEEKMVVFRPCPPGFSAGFCLIGARLATRLPAFLAVINHRARSKTHN